MSWINNALKLRHEEFLKKVDNSLKQTAESLQNQFLLKRGAKVGTIYIGSATKKFQLQHFTTQGWFTKEEIQETIATVLKENNVKQPFEFCIINIYKYPVFSSDGFKISDMPSSYSISLADDNSSMTPETLYLSIPEDKNAFIREMAWMIVASIVFTTIIVLAFAVTVRTLFNQKNLSEIKSDFINNMTHELKTPLATISLAIDALTNEKVIHDTEKIRMYSKMIKEENKRMNKQVEKILQAARLEKEEIRLNLQDLDAHEIVAKVAQNLALQVQEKNGRLDLRLNAPDHIIEADEVHFSNIIFNLLDNAMKYSVGAPVIEVETSSQNGNLAIKVTDNGIGMDRETQSRIFEKFYRAHTGNLHNVKGFGLGLSYVKAIVDAHDGKIKVESIPGKGSTFTVTLQTKSA
jgi:two-component system phosphate regulon sensor histidine kinase PhoR